MKNIAVISGGGAWGAYTVGKLHKQNSDYDLIFGVSTGALMAPLVALKKYDLLKEAYTSVSNNDIYDYNPFNKKGNINILKAAWRIATLKPSLGETYKLRKTMERFLTPEIYKELQESGKEVIVAVQNIQIYPARIEYYSSNDCTYEDFLDWMWISACAPPVMTIVEKNGYEYVDAGLTEIASVVQGLKYAKKGDNFNVYLHRAKSINGKKSKVKNFFHYVMRLLGISRDKIENSETEFGEIKAKKKKVNININYLSNKVEGKSLIFNKEKMLEWYNIGYNE